VIPGSKLGFILACRILSSNSLNVEGSKGLQSGELGGQIFCDQWFSLLAFSQSWVILAVWARKAFSTPAKKLVLCQHIL